MKIISTVKVYKTCAYIFTTDGCQAYLDLDFQDQEFFDSYKDAEDWLKDEMRERCIEYDKDKLDGLLNMLHMLYSCENQTPRIGIPGPTMKIYSTPSALEKHLVIQNQQAIKK